MVSLDPKMFTGETLDMNGQLFQSIEESKDATQYVKTLVEALERYAFKNYTVDLSSLFQRDGPTDVEGLINPTMWDIYQLQLKEYIKEERSLKVSLKSIRAVIWGQCSTFICTKLEKQKDMKELKKNANVAELIKYIQQACMKYEDKHHPCVTLCQQFSSFHLFYQKKSLPIQKCLQIFCIMVENIERYRGEFGNSSAIIKYVIEREGLVSKDEYKKLDDNTNNTYLKKAQDQYLAVSFLLGGTSSKYNQLVANLQNSYILGEDKYPKDLEEAYNMMLSYSPLLATSTSSEKSTKELYTTGISFHQTNDENNAVDKGQRQLNITSGASGKVFENVKCFACESLGHYANNCPLQLRKFKSDKDQKADKGFSFAQLEYNLSQTEFVLNPKWVLLDTQSSCDIFYNSQLIHDIQEEAGADLKLHSNGNGCIETNMMGVVKGYGKVWYHPRSLANVLSFANVRKKFKINISTGPGDDNPAITVYRSHGKPMLFKEVTNGLYVYDASNDLSETTD